MMRFLAALFLLLAGSADAATLSILDGVGATKQMNMQTTGGGAFSNRNIVCDATDPTICATVSATLGLSVLATGKGTAGTPDTGVLTVQGISSMTPLLVNNPTAANLLATVTGLGVAGTADAGVVTIQGVAGMTPVQTTVVGGSSVTATQTTAANLKTQTTGGGSAGTADSGVLTVQGISSMTPVQVSQATAGNLNATVTGTITAIQPTGNNLHVTCDSGCSPTTNPADESGFTFGTTTMGTIGGVFQTTATSNALTTGQTGAVQVTAQRALFTNLRNASGTEIATAGAPLQVSLANTAANGTAVTVGQGTAANLNATVTGSGAAGTAATGVLTVQGITSMTPVQVSQATAANLNATVVQGTASNLKAQVTGAGTAGTADTGVQTVQGIASMTPVQVSQSTGTNLHIVCDSGCSAAGAPADEGAFSFGVTGQTPVGGVFQTTATSNALTTGQTGAFQVTAQRALFTNLRNASGTEIATSSNPVQVSVANTAANGTAIAVTAAQATAANLNATVVQGTAANLLTQVSQPTAASLNATVIGAGSAGTANAGVLTVQGITSMTPLQVTQATASTLNATVVQATGANLHVACDSGCSSSTAPADKSTFTFASTSQTPVGGVFQTTATSNPLTTGQMGAFQATAQRALFTNLRDSSGNEVGLSGQPLQVTLANTGSNATALNVAQATAANLNATVVQATATNFKALVNIQGNAGAVMDFAGQNATAPANALQIGGQFNTAPTSLTTGHSSALQLDSGANLLVNLKTAIPPGANTIGAVTQASGPWTTNVSQVFGSGAITPIVSAAAESSHVLKASAGSLFSVYAVNLTATPGYLVILNATSAPADGAITPLECVPLPAQTSGSGGAFSSGFSSGFSAGAGSASIGFTGAGFSPPDAFSTGITAVLTSATSCFTKTTGTLTGMIHAQVQ